MQSWREDKQAIGGMRSKSRKHEHNNIVGLAFSQEADFSPPVRKSAILYEQGNSVAYCEAALIQPEKLCLP